ncbi:MAG: DUF1697 domain-containing protein [Moraxella sp.]|nr:DUF1697 domain-containing protein [Moraxella sp.]
MNTYIVLLRGVMPSGKNSIKMAFLREILEQADFTNVRTYIQSGNVVLQSPLSPTEIAQKVRAVILEKNGSDLPVIVKTPAKIQAVLAENLFGEERSFFTLTNDNFDKILAQELEQQDFGEDKLKITEKAIYSYIPTNAARTKLTNNFIEKKLNITTTTRNFRTLTKLLAMGLEWEKYNL